MPTEIRILSATGVLGSGFREETLKRAMALQPAFIGADSLAFLSVEGIYQAMGYDGRDNAHPQFTDHCFTGEYPTALTDRTGEVGPRQLSLLAEAS